MKQWTAARPHYCHSPHCLKERQREAKRPLSIQELKKGGDKGPKLNKCWKAAWRASPWSCALNERERLWDNPSGSFTGETTQIHSVPGIQFNYKSTHTGVPILFESCISLGCLSGLVVIYIIHCSCFSNFHKKIGPRPPAGIRLCSLPATNNETQLSLPRTAVNNPLHVHGSCRV